MRETGSDLLAMGLACALGLLAGTASATPRELHLVNPGEPESMDPAHRHFAADRVLGTILLEGLTREDGDGNAVPGAAVSWEASTDGLHYTFHLRPEARFSDGHPVTAENFVYAARRWVDPKTASEATAAIEPVLHARDCIGGKLPPEDRFSLGAWQTHGSGVPYLDDAQANIFCVVDAMLDYGTHTIFIGRAEAVRLHGDVRPLIYGDGRFIGA